MNYGNTKTKRMHQLKLFLLAVLMFFSGCIVIPAQTASISLNQTNVRKGEVRISNVLMVGSGTVASEVFLENLSAELIQSFKTRGVPTEFTFMGKMPPSASLPLESLIQDKFDTYLVFKSSNNAYLDMSKEKVKVYGPDNMTRKKYGNQYAERYTVTLYHKKEKIQAIWQGDLAIDFDLANSSRYKEISKLILDELVKNQFLLH
jgi:hypothetical protein